MQHENNEASKAKRPTKHKNISISFIIFILFLRVVLLNIVEGVRLHEKQKKKQRNLNFTVNVPMRVNCFYDIGKWD